MTIIRWQPRPYQNVALSYILSRKFAALFLDPGLGKTSISLAAIKTLLTVNEVKAVLLVAPLRVIYSVWPNEIAKWSNFNHLDCTILHGKTKASLWDQHDIYLINPEGLAWLHGELLEKMTKGHECPFDALWIDECTKFKNASSNRFKYIRDMLPLFRRRYVMTGTPAPKGLIDLWPQIYIADEGESLGANFHKFRRKYFKSDDWNKFNWRIKEGAEHSIHLAISRVALEMSAKDHLIMPPITYNDIICDMPKRAHAQYKKMENEFFIEIDEGNVSADAAAQASMKCHQISNGSVYEDIPQDLDECEIREFKKSRRAIKIHSAKLDALKDLVEELNGKPLLVAYHYRHDLEMIKSVLGDVPHIGSGVTPSHTDEIIRKWNDGDIQVLLGHPVSMAHGLNLQGGGNDIAWFSLTWSLEDYMQFNARLYRQGVKGAVRIHHIVARDTIDEVMLMRLGERADEQRSLREAIRSYRIKDR